MAISYDGKQILYSVQSFKRELSFIVEMNKVDGVWSTPKTATFSGKYNDLEPAFSPNGKKLYFATTRPITDSIAKKDHD
jgi:Tol biopolymer transport system component